MYRRLWEDAGLKEERMEKIRATVDQMIESELMKKLNKSKSHNMIKNSIILNGFLEQVKLFIDKSLIEVIPELSEPI